MNQNEMIQSLRAEIAKLQRVLDMLLDQPSGPAETRRPGRPKGSGVKAISFSPEKFMPKKRTMSAEGKARIAAAQKKRWAAQKAAPAKSSKTTNSPKSVGKGVPKTATKSAGAGKRTTPTVTKTQAAPITSSKVAVKKGAAKKTQAKKTSRPATKRSGKPLGDPASEPQTA